MTIDWDARYAESGQIWSGNPNGALVAEVAEFAPGTAVDVGCGEGADAIWLAARGWDVMAFDVSTVALDRAAQHAEATGVRVEFVHAGLLDASPAGRAFGLVSAQYPAVLHEQGRSLAALLALVAPDGTLLFVHHSEVGSEAAREAGFDPADYLLPHDVHSALLEAADEWDVRVYVERARHVTTGAGAAHHTDVVLRARRR